MKPLIHFDCLPLRTEMLELVFIDNTMLIDILELYSDAELLKYTDSKILADKDKPFNKRLVKDYLIFLFS